VVAVEGSPPHRVLSLMGLLGHLGCVDALPEMQTRHAHAEETRRSPAEPLRHRVP
jgi:hypothetical protein